MSSQKVQGAVPSNAPNNTIEFLKNHKAETALTIVAIAAITGVGVALGLSAASTGALFPAQTFLYSSAGIAAGAVVAGFVINGVKLWNKFDQEDKDKNLINKIAKLTEQVNDEVHLKGDSKLESQKQKNRKELIDSLRSLRARILNNDITLEKAKELIKTELKDKNINLNVNLPLFLQEIKDEKILPEDRLNNEKVTGKYTISELLDEVIVKPIAAECENETAKIHELFVDVVNANAKNRLTDEEYKKAAETIRANAVYKNAPKIVKAEILNGESLEISLKKYVLANRSSAVIDRDAKDLLNVIKDKNFDQKYSDIKGSLNGSTRSVKELEAEIAKLEDNKKTLEKEFSEKNKLSQENLEAILNTKDQIDLLELSKTHSTEILNEARSFLTAWEDLRAEITKLANLKELTKETDKELDKFLSNALSELHAFENLGDVAKKDLPDVEALVKFLTEARAEAARIREEEGVKILTQLAEEYEFDASDLAFQKANQAANQQKKIIAAEAKLAKLQEQKERGIFHRTTGRSFGSLFGGAGNKVKAD
jgi:hypothetical protein